MPHYIPIFNAGRGASAPPTFNYETVAATRSSTPVPSTAAPSARVETTRSPSLSTHAPPLTILSPVPKHIPSHVSTAAFEIFAERTARVNDVDQPRWIENCLSDQNAVRVLPRPIHTRPMETFRFTELPVHPRAPLCLPPIRKRVMLAECTENAWGWVMVRPHLRRRWDYDNGRHRRPRPCV